MTIIKEQIQINIINNILIIPTGIKINTKAIYPKCNIQPRTGPQIKIRKTSLNPTKILGLDHLRIISSRISNKPNQIINKAITKVKTTLQQHTKLNSSTITNSNKSLTSQIKVKPSRLICVKIILLTTSISRCIFSSRRRQFHLCFKLNNLHFLL